MNIFILHRETYHQLYNCTAVDLTSTGRPNVPLGLGYLAVGITFELLYIPCMKVLWSPPLRQNSAHKIMFQLGFLDMCTLVINSIITGYLTIVGAVYCTYPNFIYVAGAFGLGLWYATCVTSVTLGINRSIDIWFPDHMGKLFKGKRTYLWCSLAFIYGFWFAWSTKPITYSSNAFAWFFDPYFEIEVVVDHSVYENRYHSFHNSATVVVTFCMYIFLSLSVWWKCRKSHLHTETVTEVQKQIILQACLICLCNLIAASIYIYMQYFYTPTWLIVVGQSTWIACHGGAVIVYLSFNKTIQEEVFGRVRRRPSDQIMIRNMTTTVASSVFPLRTSFVVER